MARSETPHSVFSWRRDASFSRRSKNRAPSIRHNKSFGGRYVLDGDGFPHVLYAYCLYLPPLKVISV